MINEPKAGDLIISETDTSLWSYHLRLIGPEGTKFGGGAPNALCGQKLGWDTRLPLTAWNSQLKHQPFSYCKQCQQIAGL